MRKLWPLVIISLLGLAACSSDDPATPVVAEPKAPFAASEDQLMANFRQAYETMDAEVFGDLLHPDFSMTLQLETANQFPLLGPSLDQAEELRISQRMLGGRLVTDDNGSLVPAVSAISFNTFEQQGAWGTTQDGHEFPNARYGLFYVSIGFERAGYSNITVNGQVQFFATSSDSLDNGTIRQHWRIIGQQDLTIGYGKGVEHTPWGSAKAMFH